MPETNENNVAAEAMEVTITDLFTTVFASDWNNFEEAEAIKFRNLLEAFVSGANMLREKFDGDVWKGHSDGSVSINIKSIRQPRTGDKPGRKAKELTPAEQLAKRLAK